MMRSFQLMYSCDLRLPHNTPWILTGLIFCNMYTKYFDKYSVLPTIESGIDALLSDAIVIPNSRAIAPYGVVLIMMSSVLSCPFYSIRNARHW